MEKLEETRPEGLPEGQPSSQPELEKDHSFFLIPYLKEFDGKKELQTYNENKETKFLSSTTERIGYFLTFIYEKIHSQGFCFGLSEAFDFCSTSSQKEEGGENNKFLYVTENVKTPVFRDDKNFFLGHEEKIPPEYIFERKYNGQISDLWVIGIMILQNVLIYTNYKKLIQRFKKPILILLKEWDSDEMNRLYTQNEKIFFGCLLNDLLIKRKPLNLILNKYYNAKYEVLTFVTKSIIPPTKKKVFSEIKTKYIKIFNLEFFVDNFLYFNKKKISSQNNIFLYGDTIRALEEYIKEDVIPSFFYFIEAAGSQKENLVDIIVKEENLFFLKFAFIIKFFCVFFLVRRGFFNLASSSFTKEEAEDKQEIIDYLSYDIVKTISNGKLKDKLYFSDLISDLFRKL